MTAASHPLALLARASDLMKVSLDGAARVGPSCPTPCSEWDLGTLVNHVSDSLATLTELISGNRPRSASEGGCRPAQSELQRLLLAISRAPRDRADVGLTAVTGAFELTVHAWDVNESTGCRTPLPADLMSTLLSLAPLVLGRIERDGLFSSSYPPSAEQRTDTDRLLAMFGRRQLTSGIE